MFIKKVAKSHVYHTYPISDVGKVHRAIENREKKIGTILVISFNTY